MHDVTDVKPDRYVTFRGIDGNGNARRLITMLLHHIDDPAKSNPFWEKFREKLATAGSVEANSGRVLDELVLVHSYINYFRDLFEEYDDQEALTLLHQIEAESC